MRTRVRRAWRVDLQACFITLRHDYRITAGTRLEYPATNFILLSSCEGCRQCTPPALCNSTMRARTEARAPVKKTSSLVLQASIVHRPAGSANRSRYHVVSCRFFTGQN